VELILAVREASRARFGGFRRGRQHPLASHRFHLIDAGRYTAALSDDSKLKPDLGLLTYLQGAGRTQAHKWIGQHLSSVGKRETIDLAAHFYGDLSKAADDEPADEEPPEKLLSRA
jgi:NTE family protein